MEIADVDAILLSHVYPEDEQLEWSAGTIESWDAALIRVETIDGIVGWGEAGHALTGTEAVPGIVDALADRVIGRDPKNVLAIREELSGSNLFWARGALPLGVIGAIEIAIYDVLGQAAGVPVHELLGGRTGEDVRTYGSGGIAATVEERIEQAVSFAERGFDIVKVRAVGEPMANVEYVERLLGALDEDIQVAFDAVQGSAGSSWSVTDAIRLGKALEPFADRIYWYEEPCRSTNLDGFNRVRDAVDLPVAGIESRTGRYEFRDVIDAGSVDVLQPDVTIAGGFDETFTISGYAASHDVPLAMHVWGTGVSLMANLQYAIADRNCGMIEYCQLPNPLREEMLPDSFACDGERISVPDEPGLGVDISEGFLDAHAFVPGKGHVFD